MVEAEECSPAEPGEVAVVAHTGKSMVGGLGELRRVLSDAGHADAHWYEVRKSKKAPDCVREALDVGAKLVFVWGGDGMMQRCVDVLAGTDVTLAILPAGTGNLLARNLAIPETIEEAVRTGLEGDCRRLDTGKVNGEHFAVMAGAGLDALMIDDADSGLKDRLGRAAYVLTGARNLGIRPVQATVKVDGRRFYRGPITCLLAGNMSKVLGGIDLFEGSEPDDGLLDVGVVTAQGRVQWVRTMGRVVAGHPERSPFVATTRGAQIRVMLEKPTPYELDGGARKPTTKLKIKMHPGSMRVKVPPGGPDGAKRRGADQ